MHKIKLILLLILPLSVLGQDLGIIDTKTTKNPAINGTHRISTDGKNLFFRNFFGLSKKVASTDSAVFTGTTVLPSNTTIGNVSATELGYLDGITSPIQAQINSIGGNKVFYGTVDVTNAVSLTANVGDLYINTTSKAVYKKTNLSFPTGLTYIALPSGTWVKLGNFSLTKSDVGLSDVDNTSDANKPVSSATQTALNGKENTLTKGNLTSTDLTITGGTNSIIGTGVTISLSSLGRIRHFSGVGDVTNDISLTANIGDIYFNTTSGTVYQKSNLSFPSGLTYITFASGTWVKLGDFTLNKSKVGLSDVDNTSDANKPISTLTQNALNAKENTLTKGNITSTDLTVTGGTNAIIGAGVNLSIASTGRQRIFYGTVDVTNAVSLTANFGDLYINTTSKAVYEKSSLSFPTGLAYIALPDATWVKLGNFSVTKSDIGLSDVDNTSDVNKPISSATQTALDGKVSIATAQNITGIKTFQHNISSYMGYYNNTNMSGKGVKFTNTGIFPAIEVWQDLGETAGVQLWANGDGDFANYLRTKYFQMSNGGGVNKILSSDANGFGSWISNTSLPISTAMQTALDLKLTSTTAASTYLPIANPTATGTLTAPTISNSLGATFATSSGNVGIGTIAPTQKLDVNGNINTNGAIYFNSRLFAYTNGNYSILHDMNATSGTAHANIYMGQGDETNYYDNSGHTFRNRAGTSNRLQIFGNGNVGIGTGGVDASYKLDVNGSAKVNADLTVVNGGKFVGQAGTYFNGNQILIDFVGSSYGRIQSINGNTITPQPLALQTIGGNVGIGTTTPTQKLDVDGYIRAFSVSGGGAYYSSTTATDAAARNWVMRGNSVVYGDFDIRQSNALSGDPIAAGNSRFYINASGNVGIGTTSPSTSAILDITSTTKGVLFPRLTTGEINLIASPANGLTVYNTTLSALCFYDGTGWKRVVHLAM